MRVFVCVGWRGVWDLRWERRAEEGLIAVVEERKGRISSISFKVEKQKKKEKKEFRPCEPEARAILPKANSRQEN